MNMKIKSSLIGFLFAFLVIGLIFSQNIPVYGDTNSQITSSSVPSSDKIKDEIAKKFESIANSDSKLADQYNKVAKEMELTASQEVRLIDQDKATLAFIAINEGNKAIADLQGNPAFTDVIKAIQHDIQINEAVVKLDEAAAKADEQRAQQLLAEANALEKEAQGLESPVTCHKVNC